MHFRGEMDDELTNRNWIVKDLGTVTCDNNVSFRYGFRRDERVRPRVPLQVQLLYTARDGAVKLRVATATIEVTEDRSEAERDANVAVVATHAAQAAARLARRGSFSKAQMETRAAQRFVQRNESDESKVTRWTKQVSALDGAMKSKKKSRKSAAAGGVVLAQKSSMAAQEEMADEEYGALYCAENALY
eukprot:TRINITY_DN556_c0_g1_i3.p3 TRINITY_DN556_c0_g1~~TRINITY_DN556_c0_g1_i3.p3  ORF type:complete len:189 (-),score=131.44 TRINITY_DN556_c0_g1_i3:53-619(-)